MDIVLLAIPAGSFGSLVRNTQPPASTYALVGATLIAAALVYFVFLEGRYGATLGKRVFGLRVVCSTTSRPIGYPRALIRTVARAVSAAPFYLGFLWCLVDARNRTWHDILSGSLVVQLSTPRNPAPR
jgi:uncharacterized RDD family membrane protein YckC